MDSTIWYDEKSMANIFSFGELVDKYCITYNSNKEDTFYLHGESKTIKFPRSTEGLYFHQFNDGYKEQVRKLNGEVCLINTVQENMEGFSTKQIE